MLLPLLASADGAKIDGIYYYFDSGGKTATVDHDPDEPISEDNWNFHYKGDIVIPSNVTYDGVTYTVKSIASDAFYWCYLVTSITIPSSVTSIGDDAFSRCIGLTSIKVESGNQHYDSRNNCNAIIETSSNKLIVGCRKTVIPNSVEIIGSHAFSANYLTSVTIPDGVKSIESGAFEYSHLTSVTIPNSVTSIGQDAFLSCRDLTSITIPNSVKSIGNGAFSDTGWFNNQSDGVVYAGKVAYKYKGTMPNNTSITINDGTIGIADQAFSMRSGLTSVTIPNSVTSIGSSAFRGCNGLTSITIPSSVTSIGSSAFYNCRGLTSIAVEDGNQYYDSRNNCNAIIEKSTNTLVVGCNNTFIPNGVTSIGSHAFSFCSGLTSITIPSSVTSIGGNAFSYCSGLTSISIPSSVTSIGSYAFSNCNNLQFICFTSDKYPSNNFLGTTSCQIIMPLTAFYRGVPGNVKNFAAYSVTPMYIKVKSTTATSATLELTPIDIASGKINGATTYETKIFNIKPSTPVSGPWELGDKDRGVLFMPTEFTQSLVMTVQPAIPLSTVKARLSATINEPDDDKHYGFEWLQYDAPDNMTPYQVPAQLYNGKIVGSLSNLNPDISYKYRPFLKTNGGTVYRGNWETFNTGDAGMLYEPEVYTRDATDVSPNGAIISGVFTDGTDDAEESGFEYSPTESSTRGNNVVKVVLSENDTSVSIDGLEPGTKYAYRAYMKTASGTIYGEYKTFKTLLMGDANNDGKVNVADVVEVVNAKAGKASASFKMNNADMDGNGSLTEADNTAIVNKIMQK